MNLAEALAALLKVHEALTAAWKVEQSASRRSRLRSIMLKIDREIIGINDEMLVNNAARYRPQRGNFERAVKDLRWLRNQADHFAVPDAYAARIVSWAASMLPLL